MNVALKSGCCRGHGQRPKESILFARAGGESAQVMGHQYVTRPIEQRNADTCVILSGEFLLLHYLYYSTTLLRTNYLICQISDFCLWLTCQKGSKGSTPTGIGPHVITYANV